MATVTKGFDARLANRPFLVFDFRALWHSGLSTRRRIPELKCSYFGITMLKWINPTVLLHIATDYGRGTYFSTQFNYSARDEFSPADADGVKHILLCLVATGSFVAGSEELLEPPVRDDGLHRHNAVCNNLAEPTVTS